MRTPYSLSNAKFSQDAHIAARQTLYPDLFGTSNLTFEDTILGKGNEQNDILDGQMGIDRLVNVSVESLQYPLSFTIQERFRRPQFAKYKDITITEWNHSSNLPSELYKIKAGIFVYGYYLSSNIFIEAIAVNTESLKLSIVHNQIEYRIEQNRRSNQTFLSFTFDVLRGAGLIIKHWIDPRIKRVIELSTNKAIPIQARRIAQEVDIPFEHIKIILHSQAQWLETRRIDK